MGGHASTSDVYAAAKEAKPRGALTLTTARGSGASPAAHSFTLENVLDILQPCPLAALRAALERFVSAEERAAFVAKAAVGSSGVTELVIANVRENLRLAGEVPANLEGALRQALELHEHWRFCADLAPPTLAGSESRSITFAPEEMGAVRRLIFPQVPAAMLDPSRIQSLRVRQLEGTARDARPVAIVAVGPPGSGKTRLLPEFVRVLHRFFDTPAKASSFVQVDPDFFLVNVFNSDNAHRDATNFCNHESLLTAVGQRRHILFDHVGKDLPNTCCRCISRFLEANYRVFICVVLASFDTCRRRIRQRFELTGRDVPEGFVRSTFQALQLAVPKYIERRAHLAEAIAIFDNDADAANPSGAPEAPVLLLSAETDALHAMALARRRLDLPWLAGEVCRLSADGSTLTV